jgi:glycosyltransferase involved in cell wall biosynthesis
MKRVLLIAHAFVPAAPIGTMRTLRLVRRLAADGWHATVLMSSPRTYTPDTPIDTSLLDRMPAGVNLLHAPTLRVLMRAQRLGRHGGTRRQRAYELPDSMGIGSPSSARPSLARRIVRTLDEVTSIPDKEMGWILPAVPVGLAHIVRRRPHVLYSTAPPWTGQVVGYVLAKLTGLPWVADFRDPWARAPWRESQPERQRRAAAALERRVIGRADAVLFATRSNRDEYAHYYGEAAARKFHVVPNGCDPEEFAGLATSPDSDRFTVLHAGSLYGARSPVPLFQAIAQAIASGTIDPSRFRLRLIGPVSSAHDLPAAADALALNGVVEFVPRVPRQQIIAEMARASCLLLLQPGTTVSIPGKVYEYFATGRPILGLCEAGELTDLLRQSGAGLAVLPHDASAIEAGLLEMIRMVATGDFTRAPAHLFDGNRSADQALAILEQVALRSAASMPPQADATSNMNPTRHVER